MTIPPFDGAIRGGRVHGRGASDTKGTMAAMLWAFRELGDRLGSLDCEVAFVGLMGEETGQPGSRHFAGEHGDEFDFALVGEPTSLDIVHTHKGCFWTKVITRGVACHGATPEKGENAIVKMSRLVEALDGDFRKALAAFDDPVLGHATINIGTIRGGTRANIVPDRCELELDLRLTPSISLDEAREKLTAFLLELDPDMELRPMLECTPLATDPEHALAQRLLSVEKPGGGEVALTGAPWFCDAAVLADGGIPAVAIGPGSIAEAHTVDEGLAVADLEAGAEFYRRFLESFGA